MARLFRGMPADSAVRLRNRHSAAFVGSDISESHFAAVPEWKYTCLINGTFMDKFGTLVRNVGQQSPVCGVIFWVFVLLSSCTVMNMLTRVLCEVASAVSSTE